MPLSSYTVLLVPYVMAMGLLGFAIRRWRAKRGR